MTPRLPVRAFASLLTALVCALIITGGAALWVPPGEAGIDHVVVPIVTFPVVWVVVALALYAPRRRARAWTLVAGFTLLHAILIAHHLSG